MTAGTATVRDREKGRKIASRLLTAGRAELGRQGPAALTVDHIARRAHIAHGTFYLYFANKDALLDELCRDARAAMDRIAGEFPTVTPDEAGRTSLRKWISDFCATYRTHAAVLGTLRPSPEFGLQLWGDGLERLTRLAGNVSRGMTAVAGREARLSAVACLMMLERVNYLLCSGVRLPRAELIDRVTDIFLAAFQPPPRWPE
jgi:AcrR family transcriptional regulator